MVNSILIAVLLFGAVKFFVDAANQRKDLLEVAAQADRAICKRVSRSNVVLADLLREVPARDNNPRYRQARNKALRKLKPVNCDRLPSQKPFTTL